MLKSPWTKALVWLICLAPFGQLVWRIVHQNLTANPTEFIEHFTGDWTINLIVTTLAITPLRKAVGLPDLIRFRRLIGLFAFFYACLHFTAYLWIDQSFDLASVWKDIVKRPYITVGFTGFVLLIPLAVTSTKGWIRRLGGKNWSRLHRLVYATAVAGVIHYYWLVKSDVRMPMLYGALVALLLGYRVMAKLQAGRRKVSVAAVMVIACACATWPARAADVATLKIAVQNFHQVDAGVYRGAQPADAGFHDLAQLGVKRVLDLRNQGEGQAHEKKLVEAAGMKYVSLPLGELSAPTDPDIRRAVSVLQDQSAGPIFVHCRRGKDRTGTVIACYRMDHDGWDNQKALNEARQLGMSWLQMGMQRFIMAYRATPVLTAPALAH